ncbi:MAG: ParB/RepB/Spo0J family partition protein [Oscillochloris sp.]|nr:ParB/RepB/Spo0J family partition protein [Oscillochloris sp.]
MSKRQGWKRQSWQDASAEIGEALGLEVQAGDEVRQIPDDLIEDSPYQARVSYDDAQIADLAEGMREMGFQGVLFVRPHPDGPRAGRERYQLVYGHRRRRAWRLICAERGTPCILPVVVRSFTDRHMLTIGAQENLQREDLNPLEEAQLVAWHQELYYPAGLAEIGRMLGKSEDWAKTRSRVAQLPDDLKAFVRRSPQLMTGILEISRIWPVDQAAALVLAGQAEQEALTLKQIRQQVAAYFMPPKERDEIHNQRVNALVVTEFTEEAQIPAPDTKLPAPSQEDPRPERRATPMSGAERISAETERILSQLRQWERLSVDETRRDAIHDGCVRILQEIQQIIEQLNADSQSQR